MRRLLLATSALAALMAVASAAKAADSETGGYYDYPTTFISIEGGYLFNVSPDSTSFGARDADKLGNLGDLRPGAGGGQARFELGQRIDDRWDFKVALSLIMQREDKSDTDFSETLPAPFPPITFSGDASAEQKTDLQIADFEVGYRADDLGQLQTRFFGGIRGLHASSELTLEGNSDLGNSGIDALDKLGGDFGGSAVDDVFALGPRIGVDLAFPLNDENLTLVGSASGAVLFGAVDTTEKWGGGSVSSSDSHTIWNLEGMAGLSIGIGERADLTLGYRVAEFGGLAVERSDVDKVGNFSSDNQSDLLLHGPFARVTIEIP